MKISETNKTIFLGGFGKQETNIGDKIDQRKKLYHKEAMHVVTSAKKSDQKVEDNVKDIKERICLMQEDNKRLKDSLHEVQAQMAQAKTDFGVKDDSNEQGDLELLQRAYEAKKPGSGIELTKEEQQQLAEMGELTDYQKMSMELYERADSYKEEMAKNQQKINAHTSALRDIAIERLKSQGMLEAQKAKEELLEAASKEAVGMLVNDAKGAIDEKAEEVKEAAKEQEEKEEAQEERIEAAKENKAKTEELVESSRENVKELTEQAVESEDISRDMDGEIQKILEELKLLEEDLKGLEVDMEI